MVKKSKRVKKPLSKGRRIVRNIFRTLGCLILLILILVAVMFGKTLIRCYYIYSDTGVNKVSTTLTTEQKIKDLDYMYYIACKENPKLELFEQAYGISYADLYNRYRGYIENTKSEYEFMSYLSSYLAMLPGIHNRMTTPIYSKDSTGSFPLVEIYGSQEMKDYYYSWHEDFRDDVAKYAEYNLITFMYINGKYVGVAPKDICKNHKDDYVGGVLVSIDGKDPKDMCFELFERDAVTYDSGNKCCFRSYLRFNDGTGVKRKAEILMRDGTTVTVDLYDDPAFDQVCYDGWRAYPDLFGITDSATEELPDVFAEDFVPTKYRLEADRERKIIYLDLYQCDPYEGQRLYQDLQKLLDETGADTVIIDNRQNPGGTPSFGYSGLFPMLFTHDIDYHPRYVGKYNDYTKEFATSWFARIFMGLEKMQVKDGYYYFGENFSVKGKAQRDYKIYLLTSQSTCSAADVMTALCKQYDKAVVVGTNTRGEGIGGSPLNCVLPESHFGFVYVPTVNTTQPEDGISGIQPDIYIPESLEGYLKRADMKKKGIEADSYKNRQEWDETLNKVLKMTEND